MFRILVETSARHVHLTQDQTDALFPNGVRIKKELSIKGQFAYHEKVYIRGTKISTRRSNKFVEAFNELAITVLGPPRPTPQLELSRSDIIHLGLELDAPERLSGEITDAPLVEIYTEHGAALVPLIVSMRHLHMPEDDLLASGFPVVNVWLKGSRGEYTIMDVPVRPTPGCEKPTLHLDTDESNAFGTITESRIVPLTAAQLSTYAVQNVWGRYWDHVNNAVSMVPWNPWIRQGS